MSHVQVGRWLSAIVLAVAMAAVGCQSLSRWFAGKPESIRAFENAQQLFEKERYVEAGVAYRAWLADYRDTQDVLRPFVLYKLAETYRLTRDYERAAAWYTKLIEMFSASADKSVQEVVQLSKLRIDDVGPRVKAPAEPEAPAKKEEPAKKEPGK